MICSLEDYLHDDALSLVIHHCHFFDLPALAAVSKSFFRHTAAHAGSTRELQKVRAQAATLLRTLAPDHSLEPSRARLYDELREPDRLLTNKKIIRRVSRSLYEMEVIELALIRTLTRLEAMRADMLHLGMRERSSSAIFSCSNHLLVAHRDALLPGIQAALDPVRDSIKRGAQLALPALEQAIVAMSEHFLRAAPVLALHAPFVANVLNDNAKNELQRLRKGKSPREAPLRHYLHESLANESASTVANEIERIVHSPKSRLLRFNLVFRGFVGDCKRIGMGADILDKVQEASFSLHVLCNWLSTELVRRVPRACIGPRGELCLRLNSSSSADSLGPHVPGRALALTCQRLRQMFERSSSTAQAATWW